MHWLTAARFSSKPLRLAFARAVGGLGLTALALAFAAQIPAREALAQNSDQETGAAQDTAQGTTPQADQGATPHGGHPGGTFEIFQVGTDVYVRALAVDVPRNALWVGTSVGAMEIDLETREPRQVITRKEGLANEYVFAIGLDPTGKVWFGTNAGGVTTYLDGQWKTYFPMHGLADYWVYAFAYTDDDVWIGTWDGANHFDPKTESFTTYRDELVNIWVYGLDIDDQGRVWFGTEGGVSMYDGERWSSWTHEDGLGAANYQALPESENTGLGTRERHDLNVLVGSGESYNPSYVFASKVDVLGRGVWFGTWGGGVSLFDGDKTWTSYSAEDGLAGNIVYSIAQEQDGTLWFGTNRGLSRLKDGAWSNFRHGLPGSDIYAIAIDPEGSLWLGLRSAVVRFQPQQ